MPIRRKQVYVVQHILYSKCVDCFPDLRHICITKFTVKVQLLMLLGNKVGTHFHVWETEDKFMGLCMYVTLACAWRCLLAPSRLVHFPPKERWTRPALTRTQQFLLPPSWLEIVAMWTTSIGTPLQINLFESPGRWFTRSFQMVSDCRILPVNKP